MTSGFEVTNPRDTQIPEPPVRTGVDKAASERVVWTPGVGLRTGKVVLGGSPWKVRQLPSYVQRFAQRAHAAGQKGLTASTSQERDAARFLLDRGIVHPTPAPIHRPDDVELVVPAYCNSESLDRCLASLSPQGLLVTVVDDASREPYASRIAKVAAKYGSRLLVHQVNGGPGAARNTGFAAATAPFVAFVDSDVIASTDWIRQLRPILDDERIGAVGPRVRPAVRDASAIELYEETRSELDMGPVPSRVVHGVPVGWLPTAAVLVRRSAASEPPFDPNLRVGEDVDLFWRMDEAGWTIRYAPDVVVYHQVRTSWTEFVGRRATYGTSAAPLELRHPGRLTPASPSVSGLAILAAISTGHLLAAVGIASSEFARQRALLGATVPSVVTAEITLRSLWADVFFTWHLLRRDWWPIGWTVLAFASKSRLARGMALGMMYEPLRDQILEPSELNPVRRLTMRLVDDASYGTGVIYGAIQHRVLNVVKPRLRFPSW